MPLHIDRVDTEMDVVPSDRSHGGGTAGLLEGSESELLERLRPLVLRILEDELDRLRREIG
jgi:hypothetical protein